MFKDSTILIVDDIIDNIKVAMGHLKEFNAKIIYATSGEQAIARALTVLPDLILMDVMMPEMDGIETVVKIKKEETLLDIPIIFLTAKSEPEFLKRGFEVGGVDYITKPFNGIELISRVKTHLELSNYRKNLEKKVEERTYEVQRLQDSIVEAMGSLAEYRDNETGGHIKRTTKYVHSICSALLKIDKYKDSMNEEFMELLCKSAPLHDIGKVGIRDHILLKPGKLTTDEFEIMKEHAIFGETIITRLIDNNKSATFLIYAKEIAGSHHEKWDGSGYPRGLKEEKIPLSARIMAIADVYDALISTRVYKKGFSHDDAVDIINKGKGIHFDPDLIDVFLELNTKFSRIAKEYED